VKTSETPLDTARLCILEERADRERRRAESRRWWAAMQLATDIHVCQSILRGLPVRVGNLDPFVLNRATRGGPPHPEAYLVVTSEMLDAVAEAGPIVRSRPRLHAVRGGRAA
jgi:hypothetical protein